ncbi:MAG TPA: glutamate--tRNA ligase family protein, partial [Deinococcales bacterium]|nr:glutamate--tRNA ligase family protein [Deinococcales bacterium]
GVGGPNGPYRQSERGAVYQAVLDRLPAYPCTCTRADVRAASDAPHEGQTESRYPGTCREGPTRPDSPPAWRLRVPDGEFSILDLIHGRVTENVQATTGDFVLRRADGAWAYHLAVVADDRAMNVTHVLRGEDLLSSGPRQAALHALLGWPQPTYTHVPLMRDYQGQRLAKRNGAPSVAQLRRQGANPQQLVADLARSLGWPVGQTATATDLIGMVGPWIERERQQHERGNAGG